MNKVITICLLLASLFLTTTTTVYSKTTKGKSKTKTTQTKRSSNVLGKVNVNDFLTYDIMKNGTIINPKNKNSKEWPGWWKKVDGAYILCDNYDSHGASFLGVIYKGIFYLIDESMEMQWVFDEGKQYVSFNASNNTITYRMPDNSTQTVSLSQVSSQNKSKVTWY